MTGIYPPMWSGIQFKGCGVQQKPGRLFQRTGSPMNDPPSYSDPSEPNPCAPPRQPDEAPGPDNAAVTEEAQVLALLRQLVDGSLHDAESDDQLFDWAIDRSDPARRILAIKIIAWSRDLGIDRLMDRIAAAESAEQQRALLETAMVFRITESQFRRIREVDYPPDLEARLRSWIADLKTGSEAEHASGNVSIARFALVRLDLSGPPEKRTALSVPFFWSQLRHVDHNAPNKGLITALRWLGSNDMAKRLASLQFLEICVAEKPNLVIDVAEAVLDEGRSDASRCHLLEALIRLGRPLPRSQWLRLTREGFGRYPRVAPDIARTLSRLPPRFADEPQTAEVPLRPGKSGRGRPRTAANAKPPATPPATEMAQLVLRRLPPTASQGPQATDGTAQWRDQFQHLVGLRDQALAEQICQWLVGPCPAQFHAAVEAVRQWGDGALPALLEQCCQSGLMAWQRRQLLGALVDLGQPLSDEQWLTITSFIFWNVPREAADLVEKLRTLPELPRPRTPRPPPPPA
jgi:hypothetical protein